MNKIYRIKVLGLLGLPLFALALAVLVFSWGSSTDTSEAATTGAEMSMSVGAGETPCPATKVNGEVCFGTSQQFVIVVNADAIPDGGYVGGQSWITFGATGLVCDVVTVVWPDLETEVPGGGGFSATTCNGGGLTGPITAPVPSLHKGPLFSFTFTCTDEPSSHTLVLEPIGGPNAGSGGSGYSDGTTSIPASGPDLLVNCIPAPTATPTATPPPIPKMSKSPALQNVFLTRQGSKIPPSDCLAGTNIGGLSEALNQAIVSADPKDPSAFQQLAAFEFEVHYDATKVCVDLSVGAEFEAAAAVCIVEDSVSQSQLEGVARIGCVTVGKGHAIDSLVALAQVDVYPQPEVYSQAKPNQDNGVVVQINNVNCDLGDEQGHAIPIFSCDDADITFRYLEGDVEPDCQVDAIDAQSIAFRWGAEKGSLIYKDFMNLEPSSPQADNDIDINDLQFVYGRFGSTCEEPHPLQLPVNPKA